MTTHSVRETFRGATVEQRRVRASLSQLSKRRRPMALDADKLNALIGEGLVDFGATFHAACVRIGDELGLYKGLAAGGAQTPAELAKRTGTAERYIREWLSAQAAGGLVTYDS